MLHLNDRNGLYNNTGVLAYNGSRDSAVLCQTVSAMQFLSWLL